MILNVFKIARIIYAGSKIALMIRFISSGAFILISAVTGQLSDPAIYVAARHVKKYTENMGSRFTVFRQMILKRIIFNVWIKGLSSAKTEF